jgi:hypothetical protein
MDGYEYLQHSESEIAKKRDFDKKIKKIADGNKEENFGLREEYQKNFEENEG